MLVRANVTVRVDFGHGHGLEDLGLVVGADIRTDLGTDELLFEVISPVAWVDGYSPKAFPLPRFEDLSSREQEWAHDHLCDAADLVREQIREEAAQGNHFYTGPGGERRECGGDETSICPHCEAKQRAYWEAEYRAYGSNARLVTMNDRELAEEMARAKEVK